MSDAGVVLFGKFRLLGTSTPSTLRTNIQINLLAHTDSGIYIMQKNMVRGGWSAGEKKIRSKGKKWKRGKKKGGKLH